MNVRRLVISAIVLWLTAGCSHAGVSSSTHDYALDNIYQAIEAQFKMGIEGYSENRREITSRPFAIKQDAAVSKRGLRYRGRAKAIILGDSRPYTLEIQVWIERAKEKKLPNGQKTYADYSYDHSDKRLAQELLHNIMSTLDHFSQDNLIDDFKAF